MNWNEGKIARAISVQTLAKKCVVLVDRCNWTGYECDVLAVTTDLRIIDVEVKISRSDFKADAAKDKWWRRFGSVYQGEDPATGRPRYHQPPPAHRDWPPKVWKHYVAMPRARCGTTRSSSSCRRRAQRRRALAPAVESCSMSTEPELIAQHDFEIDVAAPPMMVGAQVADAVLPLVAKVACEGMTPAERALFWHGLMAAITAAMGAQVGLVQSEGIMAACIGYGRRMAAEEAERANGVH